MNKETLKLAWLKVKAWLLALAANMWEDYLKDKLKEQIDTLLIRGVNLANAYYGTKEYKKKKDSVMDFIFKNIQLPIALKPFKGLIKSILSNTIEKKIEKALGIANDFVDRL